VYALKRNGIAKQSVANEPPDKILQRGCFRDDRIAAVTR
jgi:hypothetical protein